MAHRTSIRTRWPLSINALKKSSPLNKDFWNKGTTFWGVLSTCPLPLFPPHDTNIEAISPCALRVNQKTFNRDCSMNI